MLKGLKQIFHRIAIMPKPRWISAIIRQLVLWFVPKRLRVNGITYVFNPDDYLLAGVMFLGLYEKSERKLFAELIEPGDLVIDIGANIGIFTGIAAQRTGPTGKVISFEPEPENAGYLQQMLTLNQLQNVRLESLGIADRKSTFRLYLSKENKGDHRLEPSEEARESIEISTVALDQYLHGELPRVIKMDIQGAEGLAIQGMTETLRQMPEGAVMMEFWPYALRRAGCDPGTILEKFTASGFRGFEIDTIKDTVQAAEPTHLLAMETEDESANLLFLKGETFRDRILQKL